MKNERYFKKSLDQLLYNIGVSYTQLKSTFKEMNPYLLDFFNLEKYRIEADFKNKINKRSRDNDIKYKAIKDNHNNNIKKIESNYNYSMQSSNQEFNKIKEQLKDDYENEILAIENAFKDMERDNTYEWISWNNSSWENYVPMNIIQELPLTRFGEIEIKSHQKSIAVPALIPIISSKNVLFQVSGDNNDTALRAIESMMLRLLINLPPGKAKFFLIDPIGLGANMAGFMHLPENIVGKKIITESNKIEEQLKEIIMHIEIVIQQYLLNDYRNIEEYNKNAGEVEEAYRFIIIANFPSNFTDTAAQDLLKIAEKGPISGVYIIALRDTLKELPYKFELEKLEKFSTIIFQQGNQFIWNDDFFKPYQLSLDKLPPKQLFNNLIKVIGDESIKASEVKVPFSLVLKNNKKLWSNYSDQNLTAPIGKKNAKDYLDFSLGANTTLQHALIAGKTGSGKSNLLNVIIMSLCLRYSTEELLLYLIDFKEGVEFQIYAENKLPHAKVIAIQSEREFALSVLQGLEKELEVRGKIFKNSSVDNIKHYRAKDTKHKMPRIVLLVDEFQDFFTPDDPLATQLTNLLNKLVMKGRAFGVHIILASQKLSGIDFSRATADQMGIRIALVCTDADSRSILGEDNPCAKDLSRPGEAIYNDSNGTVEGNKKFQVFHLDNDLHVEYLKKLREKNGQNKIKQIVFEGDKLSKIQSNDELYNEMLNNKTVDYLSNVKVWLGEPIALKSHTIAKFKRQSCSNLLFIGQNEELICTMIIISVISIAAQLKSEHAKFHVINLSKIDTKWHNMINSLTDILPHELIFYNNKQVEGAIDKLVEIFEDRDIVANDREIPLYIYIIGLHRARILRPDGYSLSSSSEKIVNIIKNGPDIGMHTICWCDTLKKFESTLESEILSEFDLRVALQMTEDESDTFIDSPDASKLGNLYALYYDEDKIGMIEKFKPYELPSEDWISDVKQYLKKSHNNK